MCQAIAEGGRRCPRHRRDAIVAIHMAATEAALTIDAVNDIFTQLRREARHIDMGSAEDSYAQVISVLQEQVQEADVDPRYRRILAEHDQDAAPAPDTLYALTRLRRRTLESALALANELGDIADAAGVGMREVRERHDTAATGRTTAQAASHLAYTAHAHTVSHQRELPTDPNSVVALEETRAHFSPDSVQDRRPRFNDDSENIATWGRNRYMVAKYDPLDMVMAVTTGSLGTSYYRNVSPDTWQRLVSYDPVGRSSYYNGSIRGFPQFQYGSVEEAERDSFVYRCEASCGQYRSFSHVCPQRRTVQSIMANDPTRTRASITPEEVEERLQAEKDTAGNLTPAAFQRGMTTAGVTPPLDTSMSCEVHDLARRALLACGQDRLSVHSLSDIQAALMTYETGDSYELKYLPGSLTREEIDELPEGNFVHYAQVILDNNHRGVLVTAAFSPFEHVPKSSDGFSLRQDTNDQIEFYRRGKLSELPEYSSWSEANEDSLKAREEYHRDNADDTVESPSSARYFTNLSFRECAPALSAWATVEKLKEANEQGKIINAPIIWHETRHDRAAQIDELGYEVKNTPFTVTGELGMRREEDGVYTVVSPRKALRCSCRVYLVNYHCTHIDYVYHHAPKMGYQMEVNGEDASTRLPVPSQFLEEGNGVAVEEDSSTGYRTITLDIHRRVRGSHPSRFDGRVPRRIWENENDPLTLARMRSFTSAVFQRADQRDIELALASADKVVTQMHVTNLRDSTLSDEALTLYGEIHYTRNEYGDIAQEVKELRCVCVRFRESTSRGDNPPSCPHVSILHQHQEAIVPPINQTEQIENSQYLAAFDMEDHHPLVAYYTNMEVYIRSERTGVSYEEAEVEVLAERAEEERREEARRIRRVQKEREERNERAAEMQAIHDKFLEENPGYSVYRQVQQARWESVDERYGDNTEAVKQLIEETQAQKGTRANVLGLRTDGVTDGVCDPNIPGSRRFGVELEFVLPSRVNKRLALSTMAKELHEAGLADRSTLGGYHSGQNSGWASWNLEEDGTVDGELVSPLMADTPEHWEQLNKALEILKKHGAKTSTKAGSHVHVSSGSFGGKLAKGVEVLRTLKENEDVLYRAASDPSTGSHRGTTWCEPNISTSDFGDVLGHEFDSDEGDKYSARAALGDHMEHSYSVNFEGSFTPDAKAHIEYRLWDASLDAATIQRQVMASVAITEAADRETEANGGVSKARDDEALKGTKGWGASGKRLGVGTTDVDEISLKNVASFVDRVFRRKEDREDFIRLFAVNRNN